MGIQTKFGAFSVLKELGQIWSIEFSLNISCL